VSFDIDSKVTMKSALSEMRCGGKRETEEKKPTIRGN